MSHDQGEILNRINCLLCVYICHYIFPFYYLDIYSIFFCHTNKCPNNKKEIYNDKYKHTRDRLLGLGEIPTWTIFCITIFTLTASTVTF
jgi:hypothetical protein